MREPLTVAAVQPHCTPYDVGANVLAHAEAVRAAGARVVVFPELSLTGYHLDAPPVDPADPVFAPLVRACAETGSLALVGAPVREGATEAIATLAVEGDVTVAYRKMWVHGVENDRFTPGTGPVVRVVDGWRLGLAVCKDLSVPEHAAATAALGIDVYVASVLDEATDADRQAGNAHRVATAHGVWTVVASFAGSTGGGFDAALGRSSIRTPHGTVVAQAGPEPGAMARATLDPAPSDASGGAGEPFVIDGGDRSCVRLLLELRAHIAKLSPGAVVHLIATDPAAPIDLPAWCHLTGHAYLGTVEADRPTYALRVAESARATDPDSPWRPS